VVIAEEVRTKKVVAIKIIINKQRAISREEKILRLLRDTQHSVKIIEVFYSFHESVYMNNIVMEHVPITLCSLVDCLKSRNLQLELFEIKLIGYQLFEALREIHSKNIVHRDIKSANLLVFENLFLKVCDFGCSKILRNYITNDSLFGTISYRAPEVTFMLNQYDFKVDIWSAGCAMADLILLKRMFETRKEGDHAYILKNYFGNVNVFSANRSLQTNLMLKKLENFQHIERERDILFELYSMFQTEEDIAKDFFSGIFSLDPVYRFSAQEATNHQFFDSIRDRYNRLKLTYCD
jgi:serine/threonine protein kinase